MKARHQARQWAVQLLFQRDFNADFSEEGFWQDQPHHVQARKFAEVLYRGVVEHIDELDDRLERYSENWRIDRMGAVDRNIMRLALYEFFHRTDIPPVATLDEAIILARELSNEDSAKFVNGILDRAIRELDRPLRTSLPKEEP